MQINENNMTSDQTPHSARRVAWKTYQWEVSWFPGQRLTRNEAITAMTLAEIGTPADPSEQSRLQPFIQGWADEFGFTIDEVRTQIAAKPAWTLTPETTLEQADPEAGE
jgi:hypothetical protein